MYNFFETLSGIFSVDGILTSHTDESFKILYYTTEK
jgi:hypothetical protein